MASVGDIMEVRQFPRAVVAALYESDPSGGALIAENR
jgi:hypothetical protein